jgi:hypothetical protein
LEQFAKRWGVRRSAVIEIAARLTHDNPSLFFNLPASNSSTIIPEEDEDSQSTTGP